MNRRSVLRRVGAGSGVVLSVAVAGCSSDERDTGRPAPDGDSDDVEPATPRPDFAEHVTISEDWGFQPTEDGTLAVTVPLVNEAETAETVLVVVEVTADDETFVEEKELTVEGGSEETVQFVFDVVVDETEQLNISPRVLAA